MQDGPKLVGLLANVPDRDKYEIPAFTISNDYEGVGVPKGCWDARKALSRA